jgi:hypothetical protein
MRWRSEKVVCRSMFEVESLDSLTLEARIRVHGTGNAVTEKGKRKPHFSGK